jgi:hypothetical protein
MIPPAARKAQGRNTIRTGPAAPRPGGAARFLDDHVVAQVVSACPGSGCAGSPMNLLDTTITGVALPAIELERGCDH